jgi:hypothetical protein
MYDIEVIDGHSYGIISEGSDAYEFIKKMNSKLVMKKLASEPGDYTSLTTSEMVALRPGFTRQHFKRLMDVGLIRHDLDRKWDIMHPKYVRETDYYSFTEYGLEVIKHLKEHGGDIEIFLN